MNAASLEFDIIQVTRIRYHQVSLNSISPESQELDIIQVSASHSNSISSQSHEFDIFKLLTLEYLEGLKDSLRKARQTGDLQ